MQVAVQGGGARLGGLLAAVDALQTLQSQQQVQVTRIAGTSAGAIVAALFAANVNLADVRQKLTEHRATLARRVPPPTSVLPLLRLLMGKPMVDLLPLQAEFAALLQQRGVAMMKDLGVVPDTIPLFVVASNLMTNSEVTYQPLREDESVAQAVFNSCALPFYFRGPTRDKVNPLIVDGGLCANLPIDDLLKGEAEYGPVLGITFKEQNGGSNPGSLLELALATLSASIDSSVRRARARIGEKNILYVDSHVSTFEFERALKETLSEAYQQVREKATTRLTTILSELTKPAPLNVQIEAAEQPESPQTLQAHADLYAALHADTRFGYDDVRLI
ncbi:MAG: patatin-like phospholipase family protein, partial [Gemmatimonadaceae bacterium]|nr:patatin-like phospholipase family protein [Gemmatimonadaceae bacterium]